MAETPAGPPQVFAPAAPGSIPTAAGTGAAAGLKRRARSTGLPKQRYSEQGQAVNPWLDPPEIRAPGGRRWTHRGPALSAAVRREVRMLLHSKHYENDFSGWQMPFPFELPSGAPCPICTLGECGDVNCPTYRPKYPEVRAAIEEVVVQQSLQLLAQPEARGIKTYVSVGSGLLAQDWIILEKLRAAAVELQPCRAVFVELRTASPALACEGRRFTPEDGGFDLSQLGFYSPLGPEFSFSAIISFDGPSCCGSRLFDFGNFDDEEQDNIFVDVLPSPSGDPGEPGTLVFSVRRGIGEDVQMIAAGGSWVAGQPHVYLFTVSATGMMRIHIDGQLAVSQQGHPPKRLERKHLYVGKSAASSNTFIGEMRKIQVWDYCVDSASVDGVFADEAERAFTQFSTWFAQDLTVYSFASLASYAAAVQEDRRFEADLLLQVDVHEEIDGYDDFVKKVLGPQGLALTLGGPGKSWRREGAKVVEYPLQNEVLSRIEARTKLPWVFFGPGKVGQSHFCEEESRFLRLSGWPLGRCQRRRLSRSWRAERC